MSLFIGCISVAYVDENGKVDHLQPFYHKNFENPQQMTENAATKRRPLTIGHLVKHIDCLTHLWMIEGVTREKNDAFGKFMAQMSSRDPRGYKRIARKLRSFNFSTMKIIA